jgi:hypothetical protein
MLTMRCVHTSQQDGDDEPLHVLITADTEKQLQHAGEGGGCDFM